MTKELLTFNILLDLTLDWRIRWLIFLGVNDKLQCTSKKLGEKLNSFSPNIEP